VIGHHTTTRAQPQTSTALTALGILLRLLTAAGLGVDAFIHADLAHLYSANAGDISQGTLFWIEAGAACVVALLVLATGARAAYAFAFVVAASALGAIVLYRYVNVGALGPLPNMYEPLWFGRKTAAAVAESVTIVVAAAAIASDGREHRFPQEKDSINP